MIIQIYEITDVETAKELVKLGVNYVGVLTGKGKYPREVSYDKAREIFDAINGKAKGVALSMSSDISEICELVREVNPDILHLGAATGDITAAKIREIKKKFPGLKIMRSIFVTGEESIETAKSYEDAADFLLLDTLDKGMLGATGKTHDWKISKKIVEEVKIPVILAGGIGLDNAKEAINRVKPAGLDSKTKTDKEGSHEKDLEKVRKLVEAIS
ncbi:MAG: phosphoribosylanthranilate isomerase [Candidatus Woesearchaeota archaeon]